ncbi:MAG: flagellar hook-associated protein FlgK [Proteobacteria bacterium]|nr:flagellar hook-associated protein FlgK [Pseudomonadota bacterium]MBU1742230.1 flagellar hook-associated protein FlgK [Pseudomonadota bacterium]
MGGVGALLDTAKLALFTFQRAIDVTSHNVANVSTPGFSRQSLVIGTQNPEPVREGMLGRGVMPEAILRHADKFLNERLNQKHSDLSNLETQRANLERIETMLNETGEYGLAQDLTEFFNSWQDVANYPDGSPERRALLARAQQLANRFNTLIDDLDLVTKDVNQYIGAALTKVNELTAEIAELNQLILETENGGRPANDFRDRRTLLLQQLSDEISITYFETASSQVTVFTGVGKLLVESNRNWTLSMDGDRVYYDPEKDIAFPNQGLIDRNDLTGGRVKGWMEIRFDTLVDAAGQHTAVYDFKNYINQLARALIWEVNDQHSQGAGLAAFSTLTGTAIVSDPTVALKGATSGVDFFDKLVEGQTLTLYVYDAGGTPTEHTLTFTAGMTGNQLVSAINDLGAGVTASFTATGRLSLTANTGSTFAFAEDNTKLLAALGLNTFFTWDTTQPNQVGVYGSSMAVNNTVLNDSRYVAAGRVNTDDGTFDPGDNRNALDLADIKDKNVLGGPPANMTLAAYLNTMVSDLGVRVDRAQTAEGFVDQMVKELEDLRDTTSAVSLDEEMVNIIKYQKAYQMSAVLVTTADEMLQTVLNIKP